VHGAASPEPGRDMRWLSILEHREIQRVDAAACSSSRELKRCGRVARRNQPAIFQPGDPGCCLLSLGQFGAPRNSQICRLASINGAMRWLRPHIQDA
jgi:hypothetical protein